MKHLIALIISFNAHAGDLYISDDEQSHIIQACELYLSGQMTDQEIDEMQSLLDKAASSDGTYEITVNELCN